MHGNPSPLDVLRCVFDLASYCNLSIEKSIRVMIRVVEGDVDEARRYGIDIANAQDNAERGRILLAGPHRGDWERTG